MKTHRTSQPQCVVYEIKCSVTAGGWRRLSAACAARLLPVLLLLTLPAVAQAQFSYTTQNGTITITGNAVPWGALVIPTTIDGLPVTGIGDFAFYGCGDLTGVTLPNSITSIGVEAFLWCTSLTNIILPNSITSIGEGVFAFCSSLTSVTLPNGVTMIKSASFQNCSSLTSVNVPDSVTSIGNYAFYDGSNLTSVTIPDSVTRIGVGAFGYCTSLSRVTIPDSVSSIEDEAFRGCSGLVALFFTGNAPAYGEGTFSDDMNATVYYLPQTIGWGPTFGDRPTALWPFADGCWDRTDLAFLMNAIRAHSTDLIYDLNGDGKVDIADARFLVLHFTNRDGSPCAP